jgi:hypothetical protein
MGLDMYLTKKTYIGAEYEHRKMNVDIKITQDGKEIKIDSKRVSYIEEAVGYWRKANQIHKWFVDNCQGGVDDCRQAYVSREQLRELLDICERIKAESVLVPGKICNGYAFKDGKEEPIMEEGTFILNEQVAKELLPTESGFFFGSTSYDQYYMQDIDCTIEILEEVLQEGTGYDASYYYSSSW